jgi:hypothetical protein
MVGKITRAALSALIVVEIWLLPSIGRASGQGNWENRLSEEAPAQWRALQEFFSRFECTWQEDVLMTSGPIRESSSRKRLLMNGNMVRLEITILKEKNERGVDGKVNRQGVVAVNPRYLFNLKRASDAKEYSIAHYGSSNSYNINGEIGSVAYALYRVLDVPLSQWLTEPGVRTRTVERISSPDGDLVSWQGQYAPLDAPKSNVRATQLMAATWNEVTLPRRPCDFTIILDPAKHWCVRSWKALFAGPSPGTGFEMSRVIESGDEVRGYPVPRSVSEITRNLDGRERKVTSVLQHFAPRVVPETEFTLSAFGLLEMDQQTRDPGYRGRWWIGFLFGALLLGILAFFVRRHRTKVGLQA